MEPRRHRQHNDDLVSDLIAVGATPCERPVVFLCRSGNRSIRLPRRRPPPASPPSYNMPILPEANSTAGPPVGDDWRALEPAPETVATDPEAPSVRSTPLLLDAGQPGDHRRAAARCAWLEETSPR